MMTKMMTTTKHLLNLIIFLHVHPSILFQATVISCLEHCSSPLTDNSTSPLTWFQDNSPKVSHMPDGLFANYISFNSLFLAYCFPAFKVIFTFVSTSAPWCNNSLKRRERTLGCMGRMCYRNITWLWNIFTG